MNKCSSSRSFTASAVICSWSGLYHSAQGQSGITKNLTFTGFPSRRSRTSALRDKKSIRDKADVAEESRSCKSCGMYIPRIELPVSCARNMQNLDIIEVDWYSPRNFEVRCNVVCKGTSLWENSVRASKSILVFCTLLRRYPSPDQIIVLQQACLIEQQVVETVVICIFEICMENECCIGGIESTICCVRSFIENSRDLTQLLMKTFNYAISLWVFRRVRYLGSTH